MRDTATGMPRTQLGGPNGYTAAKFSPASDTLVIPSDEASRVRVWPLSASSAERVVQRPKGSGMYSARFDPSGKRIVYVDAKGRVAVRDLESGREAALGGAPAPVYGALVQP